MNRLRWTAVLVGIVGAWAAAAAVAPAGADDRALAGSASPPYRSTASRSDHTSASPPYRSTASRSDRTSASPPYRSTASPSDRTSASPPSRAGTLSAQAPSGADARDLTGTWKLNRALSQFHEVGFGMDAIPAGDEATGGRNLGWMSARPQSEAEARNMRQLVAEVRTPPAYVAITQSADAISFTDDHGRLRMFHLDGRDDPQRLDAGPMPASAKWEATKLVVRYKVGPDREIRHSLWRDLGQARLMVQTEFIERGGHDSVVRVYEPAAPGDLLTPSEPPASDRGLPAAAMPSAPGAPAGERPDRLVPAAGGEQPEGFDQRPDAEFKGLTTVGVVVEELDAQASSCGLQHDAIEAAVSKALSDEGLKVTNRSDEDTYLYVNVMTAATSGGYCFSRYDATIYTNTTARMSYGTRPVLVQVSLLHKGGVAGSSSASHGDAVVRALAGYVTQFASHIRDANK